MEGSLIEPQLVYDRIDENRRKTILLLCLFSLFLLPVLLYFSHYVWAVLLMVTAMRIPAFMEAAAGFPPSVHIYGTLVVGAGFAILVTFWEFHFAEALAVRLTRALPLAPEEAGGLRKIVENLCIGSGLPQPSLYVMEAEAPNAFTVGLSPTGAKLVVTRGLLEALDRRELEGVIAHELSHIGNYDIRLNTIAAVMESLLSFPSRVFLAPFSFLFGFNRALGVLALIWAGGILLVLVSAIVSMVATFSLRDPLVLLLLGCAGLVFYALALGPLSGRIIRLAISRQREFLADADAYLLTRNPEALARALKKISQWAGQELKASRAMARLFIVSPWEKDLVGHPPVEERIAALANMGGGFSPSVLEVVPNEDHEVVPSPSHSDEDPAPVVAAKERIPMGRAIISGTLAGTIALLVLIVAMTLLAALFAGTGGQAGTFSVGFTFIPGVVAAGVAAHKTGVRGGKILGFAIVLGWLTCMVHSWLVHALGSIFVPDAEKASLTYQIRAYFESLLAVVLAAAAGAFLSRPKVG